MLDKIKNTPTFYKNGFRRVKCPYCKKFVGKKGKNVLTTKLTDKAAQLCKCYHCKQVFLLLPPTKITKSNGEKTIKWGPELNSTLTTDLTDTDVHDTISLQ